MVYSLTWLLTLHFGQKFKVLAKNRLAALSLAYFLWVVIGGIYSSVPSEAEKDIILKIPFAAWPILIGSLTFFTEHHRKQIIQWFIVATAIAILFSFLTAVYNFTLTGDQSELYFSKLVSFRMVPPHYLGMYINFAYGISLYGLLTHRYILNKKWLNITFLGLFFISLVFIAVRMQFIVFAVLNLAVLNFFYTKVSWAKKLLWTLGILVLMFSLTIALPGSRSRLKDTVNEIISFEEMVNDKQTNARKFLWREGFQVCINNFWLGTGTGEADRALNQRLEPINARFWDGTSHYYLRDKNYNFHNAYLQHWATHGIIGLIIFLLMFIIPWFYKGATIEGNIFLLVCALSFLTESMMQRQAGVLFFSFFFTVFFIMKPSKPDISS